ncbi:YfhO family protein [uncultured Mucilaginibacter sp.]|uniref:YfhO family protein n=1 Tax=uncultured Mucilaginibacter sp. TaxID=797541 RepID=UPI002600B5A6|nr:YfhO family protein [uncultured Mucilaginibacter sp.]
MNNWFKQNGIHLAIIGLFFAICLVYFAPAFQGKVLGQSDVLQAEGTQKEINDYKAKDTTILWTNQMFGGMPTFQIWVPYPHNVTGYVVKAIKAVFPVPVDTALLYLLGAYLLFCVLRINPWLSAAGAIAFAFSSYNIILLAAGHANQAFAIAFFAPVLAGIILTLRGRYVLGGALTAFFLSMEIYANHIQMTYYLMFAILILVCIELYHAIKGKALKGFGTAIAYLAVATLLAVSVNASKLWTTFEYGQETNRGQSNLTQHTDEPSTGLGKDYAYMWSQGVGECLTFLVPNLYGGGGSVTLDQDSRVVQLLTSKNVDSTQAINFAQNLPFYWGEKPFTSGPFYFSAIICFLFVFGLIIVKNRVKWWILGTVVLTMLLSFGKNWPFVSDFFFNHFPLYNKFRSVESILAVAELCFPILAFFAVSEVIAAKDKAPILKKLLLAFYITGGLTLVLAIMPELFFSFKGSSQDGLVSQLTQTLKGDSATATAIGNALIQDRESLAKADAWRSFILIALAFGALFAFIKQKVNVTIVSVALLALVLVDLWTIDKRYLREDSFGAKEDMQQPKPREVDSFILLDKDPDFKVFDMSLNNPFQDASYLFYYKSVGGYHAAKLKRFDELQTSQFSKSINLDVLDMLNTKYIITVDQKSQGLTVHRNETACGHAWFVKSVKFAENADAEMQAISSFDPKNEAIVDKQYTSLLNDKQSSLDTTASIKLVSYNPDHMVYSSGSTTPQVAVFSEIYYNKGWKMYIDGAESPYFRADYLLRAAQIPVGNHKIEFIFHPKSYYMGESISLVGSILLVLALLGALYMEIKKKPVKEVKSQK